MSASLLQHDPSLPLALTFDYCILILFLDADEVVEGLRSLKHVFLSNGMGTGKTKAYLAALHFYWLRLVEQSMHDADVVFRPHLILTPVSPIRQTWEEIQQQFPDFKVYVYYGTQSSFPSRDAKVKSTRQLLSFLKSLDPSDPSVSFILCAGV